MLRINQLRLPVGHSQEELYARVQKVLRIKETPELTIVRRSVDARKKPELYFNYIINIKIQNEKEVYKRCDKNLVSIVEEKLYHFPVKSYDGKERPVIIGTGPAGLFCGYMLACAGFKPILLERGKSVEQRTADVQNFWDKGKLNPESNVQFGEGGAGTFSDGKLNTLVKDKSGRNRKVLELFVEAGAPEDILYDHKPHIGTDILRKVVYNIRHFIEEMGGEVRFGAKVTEILKEGNQITGVVINEEEKLFSNYVVLAPGHSARDTFAMLYEKGVEMEAKSFAIGMRVEHPQKLINYGQYGNEENETLGSAPYKVTAKTTSGRGVYSFCMCPGGYVVNASSEEGRLAINGMSYSGRDGKNANSAIIVSVTPEDFGDSHPLAGIEFQRKLEEKAFCIGHGNIPVEKYADYSQGILGASNTQNKRHKVPEDFTPEIKGTWEFAPVHEILPSELSEAFVEGMKQFGRVIEGFDDGNVLIEGIESRTSSPLRIVRDEFLQTKFKGLYPCGEGAGYAGGITSAAMDGIHVAEEVALHMIKAKEDYLWKRES